MDETDGRFVFVFVSTWLLFGIAVRSQMRNALQSAISAFHSTIDSQCLASIPGVAQRVAKKIALSTLPNGSMLRQGKSINAAFV